MSRENVKKWKSNSEVMTFLLHVILHVCSAVAFVSGLVIAKTDSPVVTGT